MPQATWLKSNEFQDGEFTFGMAYGASVNVHFGHKWGVGADMIFSNEGQKFSNNNVESQMELSYFKIPLLLHFNSDPNASTPFLFEMGVQFTTLTKAKYTVDGEVLADEDGNEIDMKELFKSSNMGGVIAFGPGFYIGDHLMFTTMIRLDMQFSDSIDDDVNISIDNDTRSETYPITLGLKLGLKWILGEGAGYD